MKTKVVFKNVTKKYSIYTKKADKIKDLFSFNKKIKSFYALQNISFEVFEGETIGIVGINGSGKSTLSNLLAQVVAPSEGYINMNGTPSLIAISAGLNNHLSGLENIELKCLMHGLSKEEITELRPLIIDFAELGDFIKQPVKNYSSGMKSRLGFAISVHCNPDILVVDEALSVGDQTFYKKCMERVDEFKEQGKTIFFISHSLSQIENISDRVMWMHYGQLKEFGETNEVVKSYKEFINWFNKLSAEDKKEYKKKHTKDQSFKTSDAPSRQKKSTKKINWWFYLQALFLMVLLIATGSFLFFENPIKSIAAFSKDALSFSTPENTSSPSKPKEDRNDAAMIKVDKQGIVTVDEAEIFNDEDKSVSQGNLVFGDQIWVNQQNDDVSEISVKDESYFIDSKSIDIADLKKADNVTISKLKNVFDESLTQSYEYFLAFLDSDYSEILNSLKGLTEETDQKLVYGYDGVTYVFDDKGKVTEVIFDGVNLNGLTKDLIDRAAVVSEDENHFYYKSSDYSMILEEGTLRIILSKQ
jgi:teichoic acid transport system ATP-binding protein